MPFLPQFIASLGVVDNLYTWSGMTYAVSFLASAIMSPIWGNLADRYGRKPMLLRSGIALTIVYLLMSIVTNPYQLFVLRIANGLFAGFVPSAMALMATTMPQAKAGRAMAVLATAVASGIILGPMIGGVLAAIFPVRVAMRTAGLMMFFATLLVLVLIKEYFSPQSSKPTSPLEDLRIATAHPQLGAVLFATMLASASFQAVEPMLTAFVPTLVQEGSITNLLLLANSGWVYRNLVKRRPSAVSAGTPVKT